MLIETEKQSFSLVFCVSKTLVQRNYTHYVVLWLVQGEAGISNAHF